MSLVVAGSAIEIYLVATFSLASNLHHGATP